MGEVRINRELLTRAVQDLRRLHAKQPCDCDGTKTCATQDRITRIQGLLFRNPA